MGEGGETIKEKGDTEWRTGDTPPEGVYTCMECGYTIIVPEMERTLPVCPDCGWGMWMKV